MGKDFTAHIVGDSPRAGDWLHVFGGPSVPITSPVPIRANLPGHPDTLIYLVDLPLLTPEQRTRLVEHIAGRFGIPVAEVETDLDASGYPILADDVIVSIKNPMRWL